jgi:hypothetical protein
MLPLGIEQMMHIARQHWLLDRSDTPWYPTMRLFRQHQPGQWAGPVGEVVKGLTELALQ